MNIPIKVLPFEVDITSLQNKLVANHNLFNLYAHRRITNGPHRESSDIWARYGDIETIGPRVFVDKHESIWYKVSEELPEVIEIANYLMYKLDGLQLGGVLITKIPPGGKIYPHVDICGWHPNYYDKFYVPILNKEGATFEFENIKVCGEENKVYWFRNDVSHWVNNDSTSDRIAMVICLKPKNKEFLNV